MSESTMQSATELASQYSVQVTDDLERNVKEQERVSAEITALQQQLAALQHDHALLVNMQQALGITAPPPGSATAPESATGTATVPAPRDGAPAESATGGRTRNRKAAAPKRAAATGSAAAKKASKPAAGKAAGPARKAAPRTSAKTATGTATKTSTGTTAEAAVATPAATAAGKDAKTAGKSPAKAAGKTVAKKAPASTAARPTLVELVRGHLAGQSEPRSAAEVTTALGEAHSGRTVKTTVVRTTLEGLVAKNQAQRTKQGTSVYYTATDAPASRQEHDTAAGAPAANGS
ncbi:hypothetical protein [Streptomyces sp. NPDC044948]|uniref:hypothetical protein n=1 Tax=Streptomyces sp. NPDC044948 TaxID=3157092 RepID=UPI0033F3E884